MKTLMSSSKQTSRMSRILTFVGIVCFLLLQDASASVVSTGDFSKDFFVNWSPSHVNTSLDGTTRSLTLDKDSGSGFLSNDKLLFGQFDMKIRLIPGNSAGTVVAFYLTSDEPNHDEVDFEFLGNVVGQPYTLQTNVYIDGFDSREQRIKLWFDPTKDFHTYTILWNIYQIVFMVDWVPIRTYRNHKDKGVAYPGKPMGLQVSLWNGESWATNGGKDKIDWASSPFIASFKNHKIDACIWDQGPESCWAGGPDKWWNNERFNSLTWAQRRLFRWARKYYLTYDYCQDNQRFNNTLPKECLLPKY
ncbi:probable xyloglucan endotransglucosylase/hydrolase protein 10 [Primulina eburnea]|uniref:probable xyloglucan endotransglucosylase/hydrolase protein 10 n=1 Tax=Primulina eburnea TaxID=1245227 RepID=UPI003C6C8C84